MRSKKPWGGQLVDGGQVSRRWVGCLEVCHEFLRVQLGEQRRVVVGGGGGESVAAAASGRDGESEGFQPSGSTFRVGGEDDVVATRLVVFFDGDDVLEPSWIQPVVLV